MARGHLSLKLNQQLKSAFRQSPFTRQRLGTCTFDQQFKTSIFQVPSKQATVLAAQINDSSTISYGETDDVVTVDLTSGFEAYATALGITTIDPNDFLKFGLRFAAPSTLVV